MGLLDDLKRQAEAVKAQQTTDDRAALRQTSLAEAAMKAASSYFIVLVQQLNVLRPRSKTTLRLDRRQVFSGLQTCDFREDTRRKTVRGEQVIDHVSLRWRVVSGTSLSLTKDFLPDIEQLEARLRQGGVRVDSEAVRDPETAKLQEMRYHLVADFNSSVLITPDHDSGLLRFVIMNIDGLETVTVEFPAFELTSTRLDDLGRWILGEPNAFLQNGRNLRRVEA